MESVMEIQLGVVHEILALLLVFAAVSWCTWVISPLVAQIGLERGEGRYVRTERGLNPIHRFTTPERLLQACWSAALLGGGTVAAILIGADVFNLYILAGAALMMGIVTFQIPRLWVNLRIVRRRQQFDAKLLDLTLGLANGLRSGAALPQTLDLVTRDIGGPMQEEFAVLLQEHRLGVDLPQALDRLCKRMPSEDLALLATAVRVTLQAGGSLAEVLDRITDTIRNRTEFQEKLRTMTAQGRFEAIAMGAAPLAAFLILFYLDPNLMKPLVQTKTGWCAICSVAFLEVIGFLVIRKIVTIRV